MYTFKARVIDDKTEKILGYIVEFPCGTLFIIKEEMDLLHGRQFSNGRVIPSGSVILSENIITLRRKIINGRDEKEKKNVSDHGRKRNVIKKV